MEEYFHKFGLDISGLCDQLQIQMCDVLPSDFDSLRIEHINNLIGLTNSQEFSKYRAILESTYTPRQKLNNNGHLDSRIWRFVEFRQANEDHRATIIRALTLREGQDVLYDSDTKTVYPQPKQHPGFFRGVSCSTHCPMQDKLLLHRQNDLPVSAKALKELEKSVSNKKVRSVIGIYLESSRIEHIDNWIIDADDMDPGHVTMAAAVELGGFSPPEQTNKVRIPYLEALPWQVHSELLILKAEAQWRDDMLDDTKDADTLSKVLNYILCYGNMDDFFTVWYLHDKIHSTTGPLSEEVLSSVGSVLQSFRLSDRHDINSPSQELTQAASLINRLLR